MRFVMTSTNSNPKSINDYLDEDPIIPSQQYFVLSYILPSKTNQLTAPLIKFRGAYRTVEECRARVEKLKKIDSMFNMFTVEAGKWGSLLTDEEINNNTEIDKEYREEKLNELFKGMKEQQEKAQEVHRETLEKRRKRAEEEGTKRFQDYLVFLNDQVTEVKFVQNMSADEFDEFKKNLKEEFVDTYLNYCKVVRTSVSAEYKFYKENEKDDEKLYDLVQDITKALKSYLK